MADDVKVLDEWEAPASYLPVVRFRLVLRGKEYRVENILEGHGDDSGWFRRFSDDVHILCRRLAERGLLPGGE